MIHTPVLVAEVVELLGAAPGKTFVDGTVGMGGHATALLQKTSPDGKLIGVDRDPNALALCRETLSAEFSRVTLHHALFSELPQIWENSGQPHWDGILLDLGVSSLQLEQEGRGLSWMRQEKLDMRMDPTQGLTAEALIRASTESEVVHILKEYGEERFAPRIAYALHEEAVKGTLTTTHDLARIVMKAIPKRAWPRKIHPATKTFQALRIAVNRELQQLDTFLENFIDMLPVGGRAAIISFHSLEDRRVKRAFQNLSDTGRARLLTKKPIQASDEEVCRNPRSRSAKLRVLEKQQ